MSFRQSVSQDGARLQTVDFDLRGIVRVRLITPGELDVAVIEKQLGRPAPSLDYEPDIVIRYQGSLNIPALRYLGLNSSGYTDEGFYVLGRKKGDVQARIPFDTIGQGQCEIVCKSGLDSVPLLVDIINLILLSKGYVPLHASAFIYDGNGVLATGWTKGGKTEALFSFANHGAQYAGDEWVVLSGDGEEMFAVPMPITLWQWQLEHIFGLAPQVSQEKRMLFMGVHVLQAIFGALERGRFQGLFPVALLGEALPSLKRQLKVVEWPQVLFQNRFCTMGVPIDRVFLMVSHSGPDIDIEACKPQEVAERMIYSNECEQMYLLEYYKAFKFAFPHLRNEFLENVNALQRSLLCSALEGKQAYKVFHPYPVSFEELFDHMQPFCER